MHTTEVSASHRPLNELPGWSDACDELRRTLTHYPPAELDAAIAEVGDWVPPATVGRVSVSMVNSLRLLMCAYRDPPWERPMNVISVDVARLARVQRELSD